MSEVKTYKLADLDDWSFDGTALAVLGHPIAHSVSPQMHNAALAEMTQRDPRFASWKYFRFDIAPDDLPVALDKFHARGFLGLNLTVPHKILAYNLAAITVGESVDPIGAVNTLVREDEGWVGYNTDGYGLATAISEDLRLELAGANVVLLGAGGAARGAAVECLQRGCANLTIINRTQRAMAELVELMSSLDISPEILIQGIATEDLSSIPADSIVINATSAGLQPDDPPPLNLRMIARPAAVYDMIYNPPMTGLLKQADQLGIPYSNGLGMLVHQGARSLEIWSGAPVPVDAMRSAVHEAMKAHA